MPAELVKVRLHIKHFRIFVFIPSPIIRDYIDSAKYVRTSYLPQAGRLVNKLRGVSGHNVPIGER